MVAGVVLVQIIKWEETMLCDMLNNEQLLYGYVISSLSKDPSGHQRRFQHVSMHCFCFFMVDGIGVLVQIIKWEETMLCDMLNNKQLLYGYVILSLSKDLHGKDIVAVV